MSKDQLNKITAYIVDDILHSEDIKVLLATVKQNYPEYSDKEASLIAAMTYLDWLGETIKQCPNKCLAFMLCDCLEQVEVEKLAKAIQGKAEAEVLFNMASLNQ